MLCVCVEQEWEIDQEGTRRCDEGGHAVLWDKDGHLPHLFILTPSPGLPWRRLVFSWTMTPC